MLEIFSSEVTDFWKCQTIVITQVTTCKILYYLVNKTSEKHSRSYEAAGKEKSANNLVKSLQL